MTAEAPIEPKWLVVPLDGSSRGDAGASIAAVLSQRLPVRIHLVTAAKYGDTQHSAAHLERMAKRVDGEATWEVADGMDPVVAIRQAVDAHAPAMVCMATHGRSRSAAILGSVAGDVLRRMHQPVLLVGCDADARLVAAADRVLVCVDGQPESEAMVPVAAAWARRLGVGLSLVTVGDPVLPAFPGAAVHRDHGPSDPDSYVARMVATCEAEGVPVEGHALWDPVSVADAIRADLRERPAALVVAATHARVGLSRLTAGSQAARIVQESSAPVLAVPIREPARA